MINAIWRNRHTLRMPIFSVVGVVIMVCLWVGFAYVSHQAGKAAWQRANDAYHQARQSLQLAEQELDNKLQYLPQYQHWQATGFIGQENRQQWLKRLREVRLQCQLFNINYEIQPQTVYQPSFINHWGNYQMQRAVMTLQLTLLHEVDLVHLLTDLRKGTSPFLVRDCEVSRLSAADHRQKTQGNLKALCEIEWLTLQPQE